MMRTSPGRCAALIGMIGLCLAGGRAVAALAPAELPAQPAQQPGTCSTSGNSVYPLVTIDNAGDGSFQCLGLSLDRGAVAGLRLETHHVAASGRQAAAMGVSINEFPLSVVESSQGAVLDGVPGHDAIVLRGHFPGSSGKVVLVASYLYNGFTDEYRSCLITLNREPNGGWRLLNRFNQTVSHIAVRTREMPLIGAFGIADLEGACTPRER